MLDVITKRTPQHPYKFQSKITPQNSIQPNEFLPPLYSMIYIFSLRALIIGEKALKNKKWKNFHASVPRFYQRFSRLLNEIKYKKVLFVAPLIMLPFTLISLSSFFVLLAYNRCSCDEHTPHSSSRCFFY